MKEHVEQFVAGTTKAAYAASGGTILGGALSLNNIALLVGIFLGIGTFLINWYFRYKHYQLAVAVADRDNKTPGDE